MSNRTLDISLTVNGERVQSRVDARKTLVDYLRDDLSLTGSHVGCEHGVCGACTVRVDREIVRLGWTTPQPVPDALRAIANRATEREPQRRYLGARSLQRALQGWLDAQAAGGDGVLGLLLDRLHSVVVQVRNEDAVHRAGAIQRSAGTLHGRA